MVRSSLHDVLATGVAEGASDWHIREDSNVVLRVDGNLIEVDFVTSREFLEHAIRLKELDDDKVDLSLHTATVIRIDQSIIATSSRLDDTIRGVSHRVANVDQRVRDIEVRR